MAERIVPQRFLDAGEESDQTLTPLEGYEKVPLVTLKEAVQPIKSLLHNIDAMVEVATRASKKPADGLTQDESGAIHLYTMQWPHPHPSLFTVLNERLRLKNRSVLISWFLFLKLFFTALYKLPSLRSVIYRGVRGNLNDQYDDDHFWWGASSCTETMNVMETFVGQTGDRTIFNIECLNGKSIQNHSYFKEEKEILLLPGSYFQVVSKWEPAKGLHIIHLREKTPSYQTMASPFGTSSTSNIATSVEQLTISTGKKKHTTTNNTASAKSKEKTKWKQHAITVAGGNERGDELNQLSNPLRVFVDDDQTLYVADCWNHRVVRWRPNENKGTIIAGGNGQGNRIDQLTRPTDVMVDKHNKSLIIADHKNRRVMRWSIENKTNQQILISDIDCLGLTMDQHGSIYVSDVEKNEVRRWKQGETKGTLVAGGNGQGNQLNQLHSPTSMFVDADDSLYVSDDDNHRVMKWRKGATEGSVVAGGNGEGSSLKQLSQPGGVIVDHLGQIYVAEWGNNRVMRWCQGSEEGEVVVGGNGKGKQSNQLNGPFGLSFDVEGNLYVADFWNHRIQKFEVDFD